MSLKGVRLGTGPPPIPNVSDGFTCVLTCVLTCVRKQSTITIFHLHDHLYVLCASLSPSRSPDRQPLFLFAFNGGDVLSLSLSMNLPTCACVCLSLCVCAYVWRVIPLQHKETAFLSLWQRSKAGLPDRRRMLCVSHLHPFL